jgi:hypothetical protein
MQLPILQKPTCYKTYMFISISCTPHYSESRQHIGAYVIYVTSVLPAKSYVNTFFYLTIVAINKKKFQF